jgi:HEAT repeat protein
MTRVTVVLVLATAMLAIGLLTVLAWYLYTAYLDRVERRLAARKSLYRELVSELATRDRALLEPTIHQMKTLYDLDALEAVLEEQARSAVGRPDWLLEVYDELGLVDKYIDKLRSAPKWRDRAFAAELLGRVGGAKAVPALLETVQATRTEDSDVREIALRALARIADPGAVEPLIAALSSADTWLTARIADIITRHGEAAVDPLMTLLTSSTHHPARAWAANVLGEVRAQRAFPLLVRALNDQDDEVRGKAATALGRLGDRRAIHHLLEHLLTDTAPFVRVRIAGTLGQFGGPEVIDRLVHALRDPAWWVRMRSVEALEQIGPAAEGPLLVALDDSDATIRSRAAAALERLGVPDSLVRMIEGGENSAEASDMLVRLSAGAARELLVELMRHSSPAVREAVMTAVRRGRRGDLTGELMHAAAHDAEPSLRSLALDTLRLIRSEQAVPVAMAALSDPDQQVRSAAIRLIGALGRRETADMLRERTRDPEPSVRAAAARALGALGAAMAQPDFLTLLGDPEPAVREAAILGAVDARLRALVPRIIELLGDDDPDVRHAAAAAAGTLGDRASVPALVRAFSEAPPDLRETITIAVTRLDVESTPALVDTLLRSQDSGSKIALARTIARLRSPGFVHVLAQLSEKPEAEVRSAAIEALGRCSRVVGAEDDIPRALVAGALGDADENVRARAVDAAVRLGLQEEGHTITGLLAGDPSSTVRERAALAVGILRLTGGEGHLLEACRRTEPTNVRAAAALAAGVFQPDSLVIRVLEMPDEAAVRELLRQRLASDPWFRLLERKLARARAVELRALSAAGAGAGQTYLARGLRSTLDTGERVRMIGGLRAFQGEQSLSALLQVVREDPGPEVRAAALVAVGDLLDTEELLGLGGRALGDPNLLVRRAAVDLLAKVPPKRAFPKLIRSLRPDEDPAVLAAAAELAAQQFQAFQESTSAAPLEPMQTVILVRVLRFLHHPELPSLVLPLSRSTWPEVREAVAELGRHRPDAMMPEMLDALTADPMIAVRLAAAGGAGAAGRYDLLDRMRQDPDMRVRRQVAIALGRSAPVGRAGLGVLEQLGLDPEMPVRAAAYVGRLLQGTPVPLPPGIDPNAAAEAVREASDVLSLRDTARGTTGEDRRLAAALALAMLQDDVALEVARADPIPAIRHRVSGALELAMQATAGRTV